MEEKEDWGTREREGPEPSNNLARELSYDVAVAVLHGVRVASMKSSSRLANLVHVLIEGVKRLTTDSSLPQRWSDIFSSRCC